MTARSWAVLAALIAVLAAGITSCAGASTHPDRNRIYHCSDNSTVPPGAASDGEQVVTFRPVTFLRRTDTDHTVVLRMDRSSTLLRLTSDRHQPHDQFEATCYWSHNHAFAGYVPRDQVVEKP